MSPKAFWKSRTFWLNAITLVAAVLGALVAHPLVAEYPQAVAALTAVVAALNLLLRFLTGTPIAWNPSRANAAYQRYPEVKR